MDYLVLVRKKIWRALILARLLFLGQPLGYLSGIETVKKLNWAPDIIHVHGWLASLLPLYLKEYYKDEPLFNESKIVTSVYNQSFNNS